MAKIGKAGEEGSGKADARAARKARLAKALRENLKRRKQQARARTLDPQNRPDEPTKAEPPKEPDQR